MDGVQVDGGEMMGSGGHGADCCLGTSVKPSSLGGDAFAKHDTSVAWARRAAGWLDATSVMVLCPGVKVVAPAWVVNDV